MYKCDGLVPPAPPRPAPEPHVWCGPPRHSAHRHSATHSLFEHGSGETSPDTAMLALPCDCDHYPLPARPDFRTTMKRQTRRKLTAVQRIEMNRFWNELEDIFDRLDDIKVEHKVDSIEEAENILNETIECDKEVESAFINGLNHGPACWCEKHGDEDEDDDDVSGYSSHFEDDEDDESVSSPSSHLDQDDSLLTSPSGYISFDDLPLPPSFDKTILSLQHFSITEI